MEEKFFGIIPYPTGLLKTIVRLPLDLQRMGLGSLTGWLPFMVLVTRGRKSGQPRPVVLEYRRHGSKYYAVSGWGERPHWYQNLLVDSDVTIQQGKRLHAARAQVIDNPDEALRALTMFRRGSVFFDAVAAQMSSAETIDHNTLVDIAGEFTIVRFDLLSTSPPLPGIQTDRAWTWQIALLAAIVFGVIMRLVRSRD